MSRELYDWETKLISIRMPAGVLKTFKKEADHQLWDKSYQRLMISVLRAWANDEQGPEKYVPKEKKKKGRK